MKKKVLLIGTLLVFVFVVYMVIGQKNQVLEAQNEKKLEKLGFSQKKADELLEDVEPKNAMKDIDNITSLARDIIHESGIKGAGIRRELGSYKTLDELNTELSKIQEAENSKYKKLIDRNNKLIKENSLDFDYNKDQSLVENYLRQQQLLILAGVDEVCTNEEVEGILLVNKSHCLAKDYVSPLQDERKVAMDEMIAAAKEDNVNIKVLSSYRDYDYQKKLFEGYVKEMGLENASQLSAVPGTSEHQTGLAVDFGAENGSCTLEECFEETPEGIWLKNNAADYGFILRYPKGKEAITGYNYEPWHFRYVGVDTARAIASADQTLEEYLGINYEIYKTK